MKKIGILLTHPIQYYSPVFRDLAKRTDLIVYYCRLPDNKTQGKDFGVEFKWDTPLLDGYDYEVLNENKKISNEIKKNSFDMFLVIGWYFKESREALAACKIRNTPIYARGDSQLMAHYFLTNLAKRIFYRHFLYQFNGFLSPGKRFTEYLEFYGVPKKKIVFCPYSVDDDFFMANSVISANEKAIERKKIGINESDTVFLFCGKLVYQKRPLDLLKAMRILGKTGAGMQAVFVGDGPMKLATMEYSKKHRLNSIFLGFKNQSALPKIYSISDCLVLPSDIPETWGMVVNEAFACGTPAIVNDRCGCASDMIDEGHTGYIYPCGNAAVLAKKMEECSGKDRAYFKKYLGKKLQVFCIDETVKAIINTADKYNREP